MMAIEILKLWLPAKFAFYLVRAGDQTRRVAGAPRLFHHRNFLAGHLAAGIDDFAHAGTSARAEIVKITLPRIERENVRARQIQDVDVVANAGAVRSLVIRPINLHVRLLPKRDFQDIRNEMGLEPVIFAKIFRRAGRIEVTKGDKTKSVNLDRTSAGFSRTSVSIRHTD